MATPLARETWGRVIMAGMDDFRDMAQSPQQRRGFERLLLLAAERGDADLVAERLGWGVDPNC